MFDYPLASDQLLARIRRRIEQTGVAHLITHGAEGYPRVRAMEDHNVREDFIFFFATDAATRKIAEIEQNARVAVSYYHSPSGDYVCVFGLAERVTDDDERRAHWRDGWDAYWPAGASDPAYVIIRIVPQALEYFDMEAKQLRRVSVPQVRRHSS